MKTKQQLVKALSASVFAAALFLCSSAVFAQVKIGSNPTTINPANNLEVESADPLKKVSIDKTTGKVTIADGSQGNGRILISDANGTATWQSAVAQRIPETVWIGEQVGTYTVTPFVGFGQLKDVIPLVARAGSLPGYDAANKAYIIQENGYYRVYVGSLIQGTVAGPLPNFVRLYGPSGVLHEFPNFYSGQGPVLTVFWESYYTAGTPIAAAVISATNGGTPQNATVSKTFVSITKLF